MIRPTPRLEIHTDRIAENLHAIVGQCAEHGVQVAAVTKVLGAIPPSWQHCRAPRCPWLPTPV